MMTLVLPWLTALGLGGFRDFERGDHRLRSSAHLRCWSGSQGNPVLDRGLRCPAGLTAILQPYLPSAGLPDASSPGSSCSIWASVIRHCIFLHDYFVGQRITSRSARDVLNILPRKIAEALKVNQSTIAAHYDAASVLFADVVEFTPMAATMSPLRARQSPQRRLPVLDDWSRSIPRKDQDDRRLLHGCLGRAARAAGSRNGPRSARARHARGSRDAIVRRSQAGFRSHQFRSGGGGRHRTQEVHLRSLGRATVTLSDGITWRTRNCSDHTQFFRAGCHQFECHNGTIDVGRGYSGDLPTVSARTRRNRPYGQTESSFVSSTGAPCGVRSAAWSQASR